MELKLPTTKHTFVAIPPGTPRPGGPPRVPSPRPGGSSLGPLIRRPLNLVLSFPISSKLYQKSLLLQYESVWRLFAAQMIKKMVRMWNVWLNYTIKKSVSNRLLIFIYLFFREIVLVFTNTE